jgi:hypothetical protein
MEVGFGSTDWFDQFFTLWYARTFPRLSHQDSRVWGTSLAAARFQTRGDCGVSGPRLWFALKGMDPPGNRELAGAAWTGGKSKIAGPSAPGTIAAKSDGTEAFLPLEAAGPRFRGDCPLGARAFLFWTRPRRPAIAPTPGGSSSLQAAASLSQPQAGGRRGIEPRPQTRNRS